MMPTQLAQDASAADSTDGGMLSLAARIVAEADAGVFPPPPSMLAKLQSGDFELDGLPIHFMHRQTPQATELHCSALVGYLPYTAQSPEKRHALTRIVLASKRLPSARFSVNHRHQIQLEGAFTLPQPAADADIVLAVLGFYQQASPILRLIAQQL
jgi:hypothetical protein